MDCSRVKELISNPEKTKEEEIHIFLRHLSSCQECRRTTSQEDRGKAVYAVVISRE